MATAAALTPLSQILAERQVEGAQVRFCMAADWQQGRTTFGGMIATLGAQAMRDVAGAGWAPDMLLRSLQTSFIAPVGAGPVVVGVRTLREGKNVRQVQALVEQDGAIAAVFTGVYGNERPTVVPERSPSQPPSVPLDEAAPVARIDDRAPGFLRHLDTRWAEGHFPFTAQESWHSRIHLRLRLDDGTVPTELLTVLLADVPPTPVISHFEAPAPASSVSWDLQLRPLRQRPAPHTWWRIDTDVHAAAGGYVNQTSRLWSPGGELAAIGHQVVAIFA